jgi:cupin fold WbuC family metalloprotein
MIKDTNFPVLSVQEIQDGLILAARSEKRRHPKLLHSPGDEFNCVFNFMMRDSYMQPHLHPGVEKIEKIYLIQGRAAAVFFNNKGEMIKCTVLEKGGVDLIEVPAFTWHTYVMLTDTVVTYETMMGVYQPETWKQFAEWAPQEGTIECNKYLDLLKSKVTHDLCP